MLKSKKTKTFTLLFVFIYVIINALSFGAAGNFAFAESSKPYEKSELESKIKSITEENLRLDRLIAETDRELSQSGEVLTLYAEKINAETLRLDYYSNLLYNYESEIEIREEKTRRTKEKISGKEVLIAENLRQINNLERQNEENLQRFAQIIINAYKSGAVTNTVMKKAAVYHNSKSFADMAISHKANQKLSRQNLEFMNEFLNSIKQHEQKREELNVEVRELEVIKTGLLTEIETLSEKKLELEKTAKECKALSDNYKQLYQKYAQNLRGLETQKNNYNSQKRVNRAEADEFDRQLKKLLTKEQGDSVNSGLPLMGGAWQRPLDSRFRRITTYFGYDSWRDGQHNGIDIAGDNSNNINWANIYAVRDGIVIAVKTTYIAGYSYGKYIAVDHGGGYISLYAHCNDIYVNKGQRVSGGQIIGAVGSTGWSTGPHLHFEIRKNGTPQNPMNYIRF